MATIILRLDKISYQGDSIGREIEINLSLPEGKSMHLARAIFGEARGTKDDARTAVAWSIRNRLGRPRRFGGGTYHAVILKPKQYSAFYAVP